MAFTARYTSGTCRNCGGNIVAGQTVRSAARYGRVGGYVHTFCPVSVAAHQRQYDEIEGRMAADEFDMNAAERDRDNAEYAAGVEDANRYRFNRDFMGHAYADAEEYARDMRGLNGDW